MKVIIALILCLCLGAITQVNAQNEVSDKTFSYTVHISGMKTAEQAEALENHLKVVKGISELDVVFIEYEIRFQCTNADMQKHKVMQEIKAVCAGRSINMKTIDRKEVGK
jgi:hypothetical protein